MKIGIDATTIYTRKPTGLGVYSVNMVNHIAKLHDDLVVWTVDDSLLQIRTSQIRRVMQSFRFLGEQLFQLRPFWVEFVLPRLIVREGIDVLYTTIPNGLCGSPVPHILTVHDLIPLAFPEERAPRSVCWNFRHRLPKILEHASAVVADSQYTRCDLLKHYSVKSSKIKVVDLGYDEDNFRPTSDMTKLSSYHLGDKKYILYVGASSPRKNIPALIKAFSGISNKVEHCLVIAGSRSESQLRELRAIASSCGVSDRLVILDYVDYSDLKVLYSGASVFAYLSAYEGFGLPVLEAMACGTPVLAANATSLPEVAGDAAILVDPQDVDAISKEMLRILSDESLRRRMREKSLLQSRKFSWRLAAQDILNICGETCG